MNGVSTWDMLPQVDKRAPESSSPIVNSWVLRKMEGLYHDSLGRIKYLYLPREMRVQKLSLIQL